MLIYLLVGKTNQSCFTLSDPDYDPSFVPSFFDDIDTLFGNFTDLKNRAIATCGSTNFQCLFDISLTKDFTSATENKAATENFAAAEKSLSKYILDFHFCRSLIERNLQKVKCTPGFLTKIECKVVQARSHSLTLEFALWIICSVLQQFHFYCKWHILATLSDSCKFCLFRVCLGFHCEGVRNSIENAQTMIARPGWSFNFHSSKRSFL